MIESIVYTFCPKCGHGFEIDAGEDKDGIRHITCPACNAEQIIFVKWKTIKKAFRDSDPELIEEWEKKFAG
ncbi:hypothetical protein [Thermoanaerobacterium sp. DL9XJH110]|uniref:hypothetical protein n=1 Tax=Thermoanaerobacterium sp. DL9XJH110 TaxID=3386643 RepID=UPI003BB4ED4C